MKKKKFNIIWIEISGTVLQFKRMLGVMKNVW